MCNITLWCIVLLDYTTVLDKQDEIRLDILDSEYISSLSSSCFVVRVCPLGPYLQSCFGLFRLVRTHYTDLVAFVRIPSVPTAPGSMVFDTYVGRKALVPLRNAMGSTPIITVIAINGSRPSGLLWRPRRLLLYNSSAYNISVLLPTYYTWDVSYLPRLKKPRPSSTLFRNSNGNFKPLLGSGGDLISVTAARRFRD